jgi:1-deoxy-D-xylulose 5-phosphate reductoisomerase
LGFTSIPEVIQQSMEAYERHGVRTIRGLDDVRAVDRWAREFALRRTQGDLSSVEGRGWISG